MKNSIDFWDKTSNYYDSKYESKNGKAYNKIISFTKKYLKADDIVLDFACGTGITTVELSRYIKKIKAIDTSVKMIDIAKDKASLNMVHNIDFFNTDIFDEKLVANSFDVITAFNILNFCEDIDKVLQRINELLKEDGIFISATDCFAEKKLPITMFKSVLSKINLFPYINKFSIKKLESFIDNNNFYCVLTHSLNNNPPNYYIVAKKNKNEN